MAETASNSAPSTTTTAEAPAPQETKKTTEAPVRWADLEDEASEEPSALSEDKGAPELGVENLKIDESKKINKFLDEPEDSNIKAVSIPDPKYLSLFLFCSTEI